MDHLSGLSRRTLALCWALAALYWQSREKYSGATYGRAMKMLRLKDPNSFRRAVKEAETAGLIDVSYRRPGDRHGAVIRLRKAVLNSLKRTLPK